MKTAFFVTLVVVLAAFSPVCAEKPNLAETGRGPTASDDWKMFRHDAAHSGFSTSDAPDNDNLLWKHSLGGGISSSPVVSGGRVYVGRDIGSLFCLDDSTGSEVWNYPTPDGIYGAPAVGLGKVIFGCADGKVYAVDSATGKAVWNYTTKDSVMTSPALSGGKVFIGSNDGFIYAINATTGSLVWSFFTGDIVFSSPAVSGSRVYAGSLNGKFYGVNIANGLEAWNFSAKNQIRSSPAVSGNRVLFGNALGTLYCLDASSGGILWSNGTNGLIASSPAFAYGRVYVGSDNKSLSAFDLATGAPLWKKDTGGAVQSSPAVADGKVFTGSNDGLLYSFNATGGNPVWNHTVGIPASPSIADGRLFISSQDGNVYCFGPGLPSLLVDISAPTAMTGGSSALVSALVTNSATGLPVENAVVTFHSDMGGSFGPADTGNTDSSGIFAATFTAPNAPGTLRITANATKAGHNGGSAYRDISIAAASKLKVDLTASPVLLESGGTSAISVHVTNESSGTDIAGAHVILSAGSGSFSDPEGDTQATGDFNTNYQGILTNLSLDIEINASASKAGFQNGTGSTHVTVNPKLNVSISANTTSVIEYDSAMITVVVTDRSLNPVPVKNAAISLSVTSGTMTPSAGSTDDLGRIDVTFTAPSTGGLTQIICTITANATKTDYIGDTVSKDITVVNRSTPILRVNVAADPLTVPNGGSSGITVTVKSSTTSENINNATVTLSSDSGGAFMPVSPPPSGGGRYLSTYNAPVVTMNTLVKITATAVAEGFGGEQSSEVSVMISSEAFENLSVFVTATETAIKSNGSSGLVVDLVGSLGDAVSGAALDFSATPSGATFDIYTENASHPGEYRTRFHPPPSLVNATDFTIKVTARKTNYFDGVNNSTVISVTPLPNKPPVCSINDPKEGDEIAIPYLVTGTASDPDNTLVSVEIRILRASDSSVVVSWSNVTGLKDWSYNWSTVVKNGVYKIVVRAGDGLTLSQECVLNVTVKNEDTGTGGIPGFETVAVLGSLLVAFAVATVLYSRKRRC